MSGTAVILGAGTYGEVYLHYLREAEVEVVGYLDDAEDKKSTSVLGVPVIGSTAMLDQLSAQGVSAVYAPIGDNELRADLHERARACGLKTPNYVHPSVICAAEIRPDAGIYILPGSVVMPYARIANDVMMGIHVSVSHHTVLEQGVFLANRALVGARVRVGRHAYIGMAGTLVSGKADLIGESSLVGAGALVLHDVPARAVVAGAPARVIRYL